ncbi:hypothetical protein ABEB36_015053 [Hypothenemus hampei]|uniref:Uncharacterized protein n=1 Tax=Hypothenemus hampei TaxID=57062 RepID=A0ABD1E185_HYPHA
MVGISEFEKYISSLLRNIIRVSPLLTLNEVHTEFIDLMEGLYNEFEDLGLGPLDYVLFRTPCVYFNENGQYFLVGDIEDDDDDDDEESSDDSSSSSEDSWSEDEEESSGDSGIGLS